MRNVIGVILAYAGLLCGMWGITGSIRAAAGAAGLGLFITAAALLIDLEDVT